MAQFIPADHSRGDADTIGGYMAVHDRPAAFEGKDGFSYSVEIMVDEVRDEIESVKGYLLFIRWTRVGAQSPEGHLESEYVAHARSVAEATKRVGALPLQAVREILDGLIDQRPSGVPARRWWDAMRDDTGVDR